MYTILLITSVFVFSPVMLWYKPHTMPDMFWGTVGGDLCHKNIKGVLISDTVFIPTKTI